MQTGCKAVIYLCFIALLQKTIKFGLLLKGVNCAMNNIISDNKTIGIIGFGHLGHSLVLPLLKNGLSRENLMISYKGSKATKDKIEALGLERCVTKNDKIMKNADIVIIATRPQDVLSLPFSPLNDDTLVVSCMAGLPAGLLETLFGKGDKTGKGGKKICRIMCSGPDTILEGNGAATMFPFDERVRQLLDFMGMKILPSSSEEELDSFTVGICIPPILLNIEVPEKDVKLGLLHMEKRYPIYGHLRKWIKKVMPQDSNVVKDGYLERVSTRGGISEAITGALRSGLSFKDALETGMERGREITGDIRREVEAFTMLAG